VRRDVFVSYSEADRDTAFELLERVERAGIACWIAPRNIAPSSDWAAEIVDAIAAARVMVLVFSASSNSSPQVRREVERAVHKEVPVLPFRIADVVPSKSLEYFLSSQHWLDAFPPPREAHYATLCAHLRALLSLPPDAGAAIGGVVAAPAAAAFVDAPFEPAQLQALERALAGAIGPVARHLVKRTARDSGDLAQLIARLAAEIDAPLDRQRFTEACRRIDK
jgi:TIR domain-containing protein